MGICPIRQSWLAWQINESCFAWGKFVDHKVHENAHSFDKKGVHKPIHDLNALLGLTTGSGPGQVNVAELEVRPYDPADWDAIAPVGPARHGRPGTVSIDDFLNADGSVQVDAPDDRVWTARKRYLSPQAAVQRYVQAGRGESRIITPDEVNGGSFGRLPNPGTDSET